MLYHILTVRITQCCYYLLCLTTIKPHLDHQYSFSQSRGGRPVTTISRLSHILLIFSSEPPRNPRPLIIMCLKVSHS